MTRQNPLPKLAALALIGTLVSAPAFAQARNPNDGGPVTLAPGAKVDGAASTPAAPTTPYYGRSANDGGLGPQPTQAQINRPASQNRTASQKPAAPSVGRSANDGGIIQ